MEKAKENGTVFMKLAEEKAGDLANMAAEKLKPVGETLLTKLHSLKVEEKTDNEPVKVEKKEE